MPIVSSSVSRCRTIFYQLKKTFINLKVISYIITLKIFSKKEMTDRHSFFLLFLLFFFFFVTA